MDRGLLDKIRGTIERITFRNEENGYTVARLKSEERGGMVTVVGYLPEVHPGQRVILSGWWTDNAKYGRQFKVVDYQTVYPATVEGIRRYLGSGLIKGIGPVTARRIVDYFGASALGVIEETPERLTEVEGIGPKRKEMITTAWQEQKEIKEVMLFLQSHGVGTAYAVKIYKQYGDEAIKVVRENPYRLAVDIWGIGFRTADKIARALGIPEDAPQRIEAGVRYVLDQAAEEGHIYLPQEELIKRCNDFLRVPSDRIEGAIANLELWGEVVREGDRVYSPPIYFAERGIAERLATLLGSEPERFDLGLGDLEGEIAALEAEKGISFSQDQRRAMTRALNCKVLIFTGGPGTGKTTTTIGIIELLERRGAKVSLAAPTGRAAKRLAEVTGRPAQTIHRLLEFSPKEWRFKRDQANPLRVDVVIVDEASMIDVPLMHHLLKALPRSATLILVGDVDQLPPVGPGNVLRDIIDSGMVEVIRLKRIFRQALESAIVVNAHRVNWGVFPRIDNRPGTDFFFSEQSDPEKIVQTIRRLCRTRLPKRYGYHPIEDIQVLSPMYRGLTGADHLNRVLQESLNPYGPECRRGGRIFRVGDKVMQIRNNYEKLVFNGDIGRITKIDPEEQTVTVLYDLPVVYDFSELEEIVPAYAVTVHKSQGSEYRAVILPLTTHHYVMLSRNLLYTAMTRARELLILIGTKKALAIAVKNDQPVKRYTTLRERLALASRASNG